MTKKISVLSAQVACLAVLVPWTTKQDKDAVFCDPYKNSRLYTVKMDSKNIKCKAVKTEDKTKRGKKIKPISMKNVQHMEVAGIRKDTLVVVIETKKKGPKATVLKFDDPGKVKTLHEIVVEKYPGIKWQCDFEDRNLKYRPNRSTSAYHNSSGKYYDHVSKNNNNNSVSSTSPAVFKKKSKEYQRNQKRVNSTPPLKSEKLVTTSLILYEGEDRYRPVSQRPRSKLVRRAQSRSSNIYVEELEKMYSPQRHRENTPLRHRRRSSTDISSDQDYHADGRSSAWTERSRYRGFEFINYSIKDTQQNVNSEKNTVEFKVPEPRVIQGPSRKHVKPKRPQYFCLDQPNAVDKSTTNDSVDSMD